MLPFKAFKAHFEYKEGYDSDEAEEEWNKALADPAVKKDNEDGELSCAVRERRRIVSQTGMTRTKALQEKQGIDDDTQLAHAQKKIKMLPDARDPLFAAAGGSVFRAGTAVLPSAVGAVCPEPQDAKVKIKEIQMSNSYFSKNISELGFCLMIFNDL